jgi:flagellar hook-associated protein 2
MDTHLQLRRNRKKEKNMGISFNASSLLNGNGLDVASVVKAILTPETSNLTALQNQQTSLTSDAGLLASYNNDLNSLATAVNALNDPSGPLASLIATSSQPSILTASADTTAISGTHQIVVSSLATTGTVYTDPVAGGPNVSILPTGQNTGDIKLQVGGTLGPIEDIPITAGSNDTLTTLASYINAQSATNSWGVTASVVSDASGSRLAIYSQSSGSPGALAITNNTTTLNFNTPVGGTNASLTVDGVPLDSPTNSIASAIPGVTLNLVSAAVGTPVQITVGPDAANATAAITTFVSAYNAVINDLNTQFSVDPTTNTEGPLGGDTALRSLQSSVLSDATYSISGNSGLVNLASLGISSNDDGTLSVDSTQLSTTFATNPAAFQNFFQNASGTGFANNFASDLINLTDPTTGALNLDIASNTTQQQSLTTQISDLQDNITTQTAALTLQYDQVNATLESYPSLLQEVTAELGALSGTTPTTTPTSSNTTPTSGTATGG